MPLFQARRAAENSPWREPWGNDERTTSRNGAYGRISGAGPVESHGAPRRHCGQFPRNGQTPLNFLTFPKIGTTFDPKGGSRKTVTIHKLLAAAFVAAATLSAQIQTGRIVGTIYDPNPRLSVPNATVVITDTSTNQVQSLTTNAAGDFVLTPVNPGVYSVEVTARASARRRSTMSRSWSGNPRAWTWTCGLATRRPRSK